MFNKLPKHTHMISSCSVDKFKSQLDKHLRNISDLPCHPGYKYIRCISSCSVVSFKSKLDCYLKNIVDLPGRPGFNNSLDSGDILQWWTPREDLASN